MLLHHGRFKNLGNLGYTYELSLHMKTKYYSEHEKHQIVDYFYRLSQCSCEIRSLYDTYAELFNHRIVKQPLQKSTVM